MSLLSFPVVLAQAQPNAQPQIKHEAFLDACQKSLACSSHLSSANQLYEQAIYGPALDEYQAAYILQPYPLILYNIARIHHKQNHLSDAIVYYQRYLDTEHSARAERVRQLLSDAKQELSAQGSKAEPPRAPFVAQPPPAALSPQPSPAALSPQPSPAALSPRPSPAAVRTPVPIYRKWWFWTILGVTAAGAATAVGIGVYAGGPDVSGLPAMTASFGN